MEDVVDASGGEAGELFFAALTPSSTGWGGGSGGLVGGLSGMVPSWHYAYHRDMYQDIIMWYTFAFDKDNFLAVSGLAPPLPDTRFQQSLISGNRVACARENGFWRPRLPPQ